MPNHVHSQQSSCSLDRISLFNQEVLARYAESFNRRYNRSGHLFDRPFGSSMKAVGKQIRANIAYIFNNPVVGGLVGSIMDYRWNLLPYYHNSCPFSERLIIRRASLSMRRAVHQIDHWRKAEKPLTYEMLDNVCTPLQALERKQLYDYIIVAYSFLDYDAMISYFNSPFEELVKLIDANGGSEYEIKEDWDDYKIYRTMLRSLSMHFPDYKVPVSSMIAAADLAAIVNHLSQMKGVEARHIRRLLHLKR